MFFPIFCYSDEHQKAESFILAKANADMHAVRKYDAHDLFALIHRNRTHLRAWLPWVDGDSEPKHTAAFIQMRLNDFASGKGFNAGIFLRQPDGTTPIVGICGFNSIQWINRSALIGYWISEDAQGKGLMTRAIQKLCAHGFGPLRLNRLEIRCATGNTKSRAVAERLGFKHEGTAREAEWLYDRFVDHEVYAVLKGEFGGVGFDPAMAVALV